jgi:hypothetical protein
MVTVILFKVVYTSVATIHSMDIGRGSAEFDSQSRQFRASGRTSERWVDDAQRRAPVTLVDVYDVYCAKGKALMQGKEAQDDAALRA